MKDQPTREATLRPSQATPAENPAPCPVVPAAPTTRVPQPQVVVPGAASRWWDAHPAQLPQSTVLWNDEPAGRTGGHDEPPPARGRSAV